MKKLSSFSILFALVFAAFLSFADLLQLGTRAIGQIINPGGGGAAGGSTGDLQVNNAGSFVGLTLGANTVACGLGAGAVACTQAQLTALINAATATLPGALPAFPNNTTTYFRGDGTYQTHNCAALTNAAASCSVDATNAGNINAGILGATFGGTGINNGAKTITLGASLLTTGAGGPTLAFPAGAQTYTFPNNTGTLAQTNLAQTFSATQTFNDGGTWGSGGISSAAAIVFGGASTQVVSWNSNEIKLGRGESTVGSLAQFNGAVAQGLHVYNTVDTISGPTNFERATFDWLTSANVLSIGTVNGGTGVARNMQFLIGGADKMDYGVTTANNWTILSSMTLSTGAFTAPRVIVNANTIPSTGIYRPAANVLGISTNTLLGAQLDASQNMQFLGGLTIGNLTAATENAGEVALAKITASGTAPGAGYLKFEATTGTNAGSCKIIAYAGTSTTPVTVVDNVGTGC